MSRCLRLLFVIDTLRSGGAQRQLVSLALGMKCRGHEVEVFCYWPETFFAQQLQEAQIPIHVHPKSRRYSAEVVRSLRRVIRAGAYDAVLSFLDGPNLYVLLATRGMRPCPKVVVSERFYDPPEGVSWRQGLPRLLYRLADHVTANSHHQRETLERKLPWLQGRISTLYNGVDLSLFRPTAHLPASNLRLLAVGSVAPYKNGLCLVRALPVLAAKYGLRPSVAWAGEHVMAGEWGDYSRQMHSAIAESHLDAQWTWLNVRRDIPDLMAGFDALVHPSYGEGLPNVVCEALACGLPVLVSNTLDHPRLVQHGVTGYLFDWRDPEDLARAIRSFAQLTDEERGEMGRRARQFAEERLSLDVFVDQYEQLFRSLAEAGPARDAEGLPAAHGAGVDCGPRGR